MNKNMLLKELSAVQFAMWELHLYMDTHPGDIEALKKYNMYLQKYMKLKNEFEERFYILTATDAQGVSWLKDPWPWEKDGCCC